MFRILITGLAILSLACIDIADAATQKKKVRHAARAPASSAPAVSAPVYPNYTRARGPQWANPNECFTDEGYGRYWPCGAGRGE
jgi:hypothetical protein